MQTTYNIMILAHGWNIQQHNNTWPLLVTSNNQFIQHNNTRQWLGTSSAENMIILHKNYNNTAGQLL